jgi:hypothetical protein
MMRAELNGVRPLASNSEKYPKRCGQGSDPSPAYRSTLSQR